MENISLLSRRKNGVKQPLYRQKSYKSLTKYPNEVLRTDFANIQLELENSNLQKLISLLEGKNKVLEEHCNLLREKNRYFETRIRDIQINEADKDANFQKDSEENDDEHNKKVTSFKDRISGAIFGVALPKFWDLLGKIKDKRREMNGFLEENGEGRPHCPIQKVDFKTKIGKIRVNLFRVVVVIGSLMIISGIGYAAYRVWKTRYRHPTYLIPLEEDDEDSGEELFRAPGPSRSTENILKTNSTHSFETPGISTDFRSILDTANNK